MAYLVRIASRAERDLASLFEEINAPDSAAARHWYRGLKQAILSLAEKPNRCAVTQENKRLRHLLYGEKPHLYRVIYRVNGRLRQVDVLHIRHGQKKIPAFRPRVRCAASGGKMQTGRRARSSNEKAQAWKKQS